MYYSRVLRPPSLFISVYRLEREDQAEVTSFRAGDCARSPRRGDRDNVLFMSNNNLQNQWSLSCT